MKTVNNFFIMISISISFACSSFINVLCTINFRSSSEIFVISSTSYSATEAMVTANIFLNEISIYYNRLLNFTLLSMSRVISILRPGATFSLYQLMGCWVINEGNVLKFHEIIIELLGNQVHMIYLFNIYVYLLFL